MELAEEKIARGRDQARVIEVKEDLKGLYAQCDTFQGDQKTKAAELEKLSLACQEAQSQSRADREELHQVKQIAAGKLYILRCKFGDIRFPQLTQI
jgi:hypothetical protein